MITAITIQFQHNKKYIVKDPNIKYPLGEDFTCNLVKYLNEDIETFKKIAALVEELNSDLTITNISETIAKHGVNLFNAPFGITVKTKTKRTYRCVGGLTIHEEDQV